MRQNQGEEHGSEKYKEDRPGRACAVTSRMLTPPPGGRGHEYLKNEEDPGDFGRGAIRLPYTLPYVLQTPTGGTMDAAAGAP